MMRWAWIALAACWLVSHVWILQTQDWTYEDPVYVQQALDAAKPPTMIGSPVSTARGFTLWTIWHQMRIAPSPLANRLINLGLSVIVAGLVAVLAYQLTLSPWLAAMPMLLHPFATETIASLAGRAELLAAMGVIGAICLALRGGWGWAVAALVIVAINAKPSAGLALVLIPIVLYVQRPSWRAAVWIAIGAVVTTLAVFSIQFEGAGPYTTNVAEWAHAQASGVFRSISLLLWPWAPNFQTVDYDYDHVSPLFVWAAWAGLAAFTAVIVACWRTHRLIALGCAWMLIVGLPRLIVQEPRAYVSEHGMYLALVGFSLALSATFGPSSQEC